MDETSQRLTKQQLDIEEILANLPEDPSGIGMCIGCQ